MFGISINTKKTIIEVCNKYIQDKCEESVLEESTYRLPRDTSNAFAQALGAYELALQICANIKIYRYDICVPEGVTSSIRRRKEAENEKN